MKKFVFLALFSLLSDSFSITFNDYYKSNPVLYIANQLFSDPQNMTTAVLPRTLSAPDSINNHVNSFEEGYFKYSMAVYDTSATSKYAIVNKKRNTMYKAIIALCGLDCKDEALKLSSNARLYSEYDGEDSYLAAQDEIDFMENYLETNKQSKIKQFINLFILRRCFLAMELIGNQNLELLTRQLNMNMSV